ncbi:MAG: hypothetical protein WCJ64_23740 [Rhodospirillaceae bacterium]
MAQRAAAARQQDDTAAAIAREIQAAVAGAGLDHLLRVQLREPSPVHSRICLTVAAETQFAQTIDIPVYVLRDVPNLSKTHAALGQLLVELNSKLAVHKATKGRAGNKEFENALLRYKSVIVESGILNGLHKNILGLVNTEFVAENLADYLSATLERSDMGFISVVIHEDENDTNLEVSTRLETIDGTEWGYGVSLPLSIILDARAYYDYRDIADLALTVLAEGLDAQHKRLAIDNADDDLLEIIQGCRAEIIASGLSSAMTDVQKTAVEALVESCNVPALQMTGPFAAMLGVLMVEEHRIPARILREMDGVAEATRELFEADDLNTRDPVAFAGMLARKIGHLPPRLAGPLAGFLYADMQHNNGDADEFRAAVTDQGKLGIWLH